MKLIQHSEYSGSTVDTDGLVLQHQGISSNSAEYVRMNFPCFMGKHLHSLIAYTVTHPCIENFACQQPISFF